VSVERRLHPDATHEFFRMAAQFQKAAEAQQYAG
jgi:hypothetical protein